MGRVRVRALVERARVAARIAHGELPGGGLHRLGEGAPLGGLELAEGLLEARGVGRGALRRGLGLGRQALQALGQRLGALAGGEVAQRVGERARRVGELARRPRAFGGRLRRTRVLRERVGERPARLGLERGERLLTVLGVARGPLGCRLGGRRHVPQALGERVLALLRGEVAQPRGELARRSARPVGVTVGRARLLRVRLLRAGHCLGHRAPSLGIERGERSLEALGVAPPCVLHGGPRRRREVLQALAQRRAPFARLERAHARRELGRARLDRVGGRHGREVVGLPAEDPSRPLELGHGLADRLGRGGLPGRRRQRGQPALQRAHRATHLVGGAVLAERQRGLEQGALEGRVARRVARGALEGLAQLGALGAVHPGEGAGLGREGAGQGLGGQPAGERGVGLDPGALAAELLLHLTQAGEGRQRVDPLVADVAREPLQREPGPPEGGRRLVGAGPLQARAEAPHGLELLTSEPRGGAAGDGRLARRRSGGQGEHDPGQRELRAERAQGAARPAPGDRARRPARGPGQRRERRLGLAPHGLGPAGARPALLRELERGAQHRPVPAAVLDQPGQHQLGRRATREPDQRAGEQAEDPRRERRERAVERRRERRAERGREQAQRRRERAAPDRVRHGAPRAQAATHQGQGAGELHGPQGSARGGVAQRRGGRGRRKAGGTGNINSEYQSKCQNGTIEATALTFGLLFSREGADVVGDSSSLALNSHAREPTSSATALPWRSWRSWRSILTRGSRPHRRQLYVGGQFSREGADLVGDSSSLAVNAC